MIDTRYSEEDVKDWEQLPMISGVITSSYFGAWLYYRDKRRDKKVNSELLDKVMQKKRTIIDEDGVMYKVVFLKDIEDMKAEVSE